jgi:hypothetical protein
LQGIVIVNVCVVSLPHNHHTFSLVSCSVQGRRWANSVIPSTTIVTGFGCLHDEYDRPEALDRSFSDDTRDTKSDATVAGRVFVLPAVHSTVTRELHFHPQPALREPIFKVATSQITQRMQLSWVWLVIQQPRSDDSSE